MALTSGGLVKRSSSYDADVLRWLQERRERVHLTVDCQIRLLLRAAMEHEQAAARAEFEQVPA